MTVVLLNIAISIRETILEFTTNNSNQPMFPNSLIKEILNGSDNKITLFYLVVLFLCYVILDMHSHMYKVKDKARYHAALLIKWVIIFINSIAARLIHIFFYVLYLDCGLHVGDYWKVSQILDIFESWISISHIFNN